MNPQHNNNMCSFHSLATISQHSAARCHIYAITCSFIFIIWFYNGTSNKTESGLAFSLKMMKPHSSKISNFKLNDE